MVSLFARMMAEFPPFREYHHQPPAPRLAFNSVIHELKQRPGGSVLDNQQERHHHPSDQLSGNNQSAAANKVNHVLDVSHGRARAHDTVHFDNAIMSVPEPGMSIPSGTIHNTVFQQNIFLNPHFSYGPLPPPSPFLLRTTEIGGMAPFPRDPAEAIMFPSVAETFFEVNPQFYCDQLRRESYNQYGHHIYQNWPNSSQVQAGPPIKRRKPRAIEPKTAAAALEDSRERRRKDAPEPHGALKTKFGRAAKFKKEGERGRIPGVREGNNAAFVVDATANIAGMLDDDGQTVSNDNKRRRRRSKCVLALVDNKEPSNTLRFSRNTFLRWITFGKLGKSGEKRQTGGDIEAMAEVSKSDKSSKWFRKSRKRLLKNEAGAEQVATWPLESGMGCTVVKERVDNNINVGNLQVTEPNCSPAQQFPMGIGYKVYSSKRKEGRKLMGFPVYPEVRVTLEDHARMERERERGEEEELERLAIQGLIFDGDWRNSVEEARPDANDSLRSKNMSADNNHSYYDYNYPPPSSTQETEEKPLRKESHHVHGGNTWIDSVFSGSVGGLDPVDSQQEQGAGGSECQVTDTSYKVKDGIEKRNASTSPIQHLSSLCTLNIPIVSPTRFISSAGRDSPDVRTDVAAAQIPPRPIPKPRGVFNRPLSHQNQDLLLLPFDEAEEDRVDRAETLIKAESDELSVNVEKILDEIADMELECWKNDMERQRNALNPIHAKTSPSRILQVGQSTFGEEGRDLLKVEGGGRSARGEITGRNEISGYQHEQQQVAQEAVVGKPPLPPNVKSAAGIRRDFLSGGLESGENSCGAMKSGSGGSLGSTKRLQKPGGHVEEKLLKFRQELHRSREELAKSHPNLDEMERTVRSSVVGADRSKGGSLRGGSSSGSASVSTSISPALLPDTGTTACSFSYSTTTNNYLPQDRQQQKHSEKSRGERTSSSNNVEPRGNGVYSRRSASSGSSTRSSSSSSRPKQQQDFVPSSTPPPTQPDPVTLEDRISKEWTTLLQRGNGNGGGDTQELRNGSALLNSTNNSQYGKTSKSITTNQHYYRSNRRVIETDLDQDTFWTGTQDDVVYKPKYERVYQLPGYGGSYNNNNGNPRSPLRDLNNKKINDENALCGTSLNHKTKSLGNLGQDSQVFGSASGGENPNPAKLKAARLMTSSSYNMAESLLSVGANNGDERARSMEFLLDDSGKNAHLLPPENKLMLDNRQLSEHELRVQRSLTKLNVPDWYKSYGRSGTASGGATPTSAPAGTTGTTLGSRNKLYGSGTGLAGGWSGLSSSKTNSLTSLQSAGRYSGRSSSALGSSSRNRATTATPSGGGRSSRESLMSPSSTASVSPSPYYERSSFTYGMPYALTRFAGARMSCGASPASLSPSPSPVGGVAGSSTSTPVTSAPLSRHHSYSKAPYLGWRSQERLAGKNLYRTPAERLAADLLVQKQRASPLGGGSSGGGGGSGTTSSSTEVNTLEKKMELTETEGSSTKTGTVSASSDLSLNNSEESSSKLHRVRSSIKEVSNAIVDYVNETKDVNGSVSPRRGYIWLETAFVGTKPIDSPGTPDTPSIMMNNNSRSEAVATTTTASNNKPEVFRFDEQVSSSRSATSGTGGPSQFALAAHRMRSEEDSYASAANNGVATYGARNEQTEERSNSSSVSSPTMEDILDSLLALRRPNKKSRSKSKGVKDSGKGAPPPPPPRLAEAPPPPPNMESDWQERMNQPLDDTAFFPTTDEYFSTTTQLTSVVYPEIDDNEEAPLGGGTLNDAAQMCESHVDDEGKDGDDNSYGFNSKSEPLEHIEKESRRKKKEEQYYTQESPNNPAAAARMTSMLSYELGVSSRDVYPASPGDSKSKDEAAGGDEDAFGSPGEILPAAVNVGGTNDSSSNPSTPAKRRVSFDLDVSDKEEKSSSRSRRESESVAGTISCRNSKCGKSAAGLEARREFKTCHNCNAYYCSRECRRAHWEKHKKVCMQSRVGALCKQIINHVKEDGFAVQQLSGVARRGVLAKGRGCVKLFFSSPDRAERFLTGGYPELPEPWYISSGDILPEEMGAQTFSELLDQCKTYNTDSRFIVYVSVCVVNEVPTSGAVKWEREMISRSAKLRLQMPKSYQESQMHHQAASALSLFPVEDGDESSGGVVVPPPVPPRDSSTVLTSTAAAVVARPTVSPPPPPVPPSSGSHEIILLESPNGDDDTLILKSVPPPTFHTLSGSETRRLREVSFANIQRHLQERGVDLRQIYPEIYTKLCNYVEHDETFLPVTIYPRNLKTGRNFMCVIMPDFTTSADTTIQHMPNPLHQILTGTVETINVALEFSSDYHLR